MVMMADKLEIGTLPQDEDQNCEDSIASVSASGSVQNAVPVRGRAEQYVPTTRRQAESEHSLQSSLASDLRATAAEFTPYFATPSAGPGDVNVTQLDPSTDLLGPMKYELDMYGIPWFYYMYQVKFAFDQGFQKGRSRSPKKTRQKKQYSTVSPTADACPQKGHGTTAAFESREEQQHISAMLPPTSTVLLAEQRAQKEHDCVVETNGTSSNDMISAEQRPFSPFAAQKEIIDRHFPYRNATVTDRPVPGIDLTTIRNVGLPHGSRSMPYQNGYRSGYQNKMPTRENNYSNTRHNHHRGNNGLYTYRGRGMAGLRMADTVPFPTPVAPQGRPANSNMTGESCGLVDIIYAAERIGGEACHDCEPDHPLD
jgi:hypothetical protein